MARADAQQTVNNFTGGLVTEASALKFPPNSLSKALNVECTIEGDLFTRMPYAEPTISYSAERSEQATEVRKFFWKEKGKQVLVFVNSNSYLFKIYSEDSLLHLSGEFTPPVGVVLTDKELLDLSFIDDDIYFHINFTQGTPSRKKSLLVRAGTGTGTIVFSDFFTRGTIDDEVNRVPSTGDTLTYTRVVIDADPAVNKTGPSVTTGIFFESTDATEGAYPGTPPSNWPGRVVIKWEGAVVHVVNGTTYGSRYSIFPFTSGGFTYHLGPRDMVTDNINSGGVFFWMVYLNGVYRTENITYETVTRGSQPIRYRDFKGVPNRSGYTLNQIVGDQTRPRLLSSYSAYNLFNAGWDKADESSKYVNNAAASSIVAVDESFAKSTKAAVGLFPSITDSYFENKVSSTTTPSAVGVYSPFLLAANKSSSAFPRRGSQVLFYKYETKETDLDPDLGTFFVPSYYVTGTLPFLAEFKDDTATQTAEGIITASGLVGGRMWYGVTGRDFNIMYSQIDYEGRALTGTDTGNLANCYQRNDPTNEDNNQIIATDGGTIALKEAGIVYKFVSFRQFVLVFCEFGVWAISGSDGNSFSPTSFSISKLSNKGVKESQSVIDIEEAVYYVTEDSLNILTVNPNGQLMCQDISSAKALTATRKFLRGFRDSFCKKVCYDERKKLILIDYSNNMVGVSNALSSTTPMNTLGSETLVFDTRLGSYYLWSSAKVRYQALSAVLEPVRGELPEIVSGNQYLRQDLGFIEQGGTVVKIFHDTIVTPVDTLFNFFLDISSDSSITFFVNNDKDYNETRNYHMCDGVEEATTLKPVCWFENVAEVPHDTLGNPIVDKGIRTATVFQELSNKTVVGGVDGDTFLPVVELAWEWEWDANRTGSCLLTNNLKYPEITTYVDRSVGISKVKVPGSGKALTLRFTTPQDVSTGYGILGYYLDFSLENRP